MNSARNTPRRLALTREAAEEKRLQAPTGRKTVAHGVSRGGAGRCEVQPAKRATEQSASTWARRSFTEDRVKQTEGCESSETCSCARIAGWKLLRIGSHGLRRGLSCITRFARSPAWIVRGSEERVEALSSGPRKARFDVWASARQRRGKAARIRSA